MACVQGGSDEDVSSDHSSDNELEGLLRRTSAKTEESSHIWIPDAEQSDEETEEEQPEEQGVLLPYTKRMQQLSSCRGEHIAMYEQL